MNLKLFFLFLIPCYLLAFGCAADPAFVVKQDSQYNLTVSCSLNEYICPSTTLCNLTSVSPNSQILINAKPMTNDGAGNLLYSILPNQTHNLGEYHATVYCNDPTSQFNSTSTFVYFISQTGTIPSTSQGIIYLAILIISVIIFLLTVFAAVSMPFRNQVNEEGIIKINYFKYIKLILFFIAYLMLIWLTWLAWNISTAFFYVDAGTGIFSSINYVLLVLIFPIFIGIVVVMVFGLLTDKKLRKQLQRGLQPR